MPELVAEAATALDIGRRTRQEDAVLADFSQGSDLGLAILSDGMGGHDDGDLASRLIVSEMFGELFFCGARLKELRDNATDAFQAALKATNNRLATHAKHGWISKDTGGTMVSVAILHGQLKWISVGDSPLYLSRGKTLRRLNQDHSMAPQIDLMVAQGAMDAETARNHPQRNCLTSALTGGDIQKVDCPQESLDLQQGDILILASDGIDVLDQKQLQRLIRQYRRTDCNRIANALMRAVRNAAEPEQDNTSLVVIKIQSADTTPCSLVASIGRELGIACNEQLRRLEHLGHALLRPLFERVGS